MIARNLARLARMDGAEVAWRGLTTARILFDRARTRVTPARWSRTGLLPALTRSPELAPLRSALAERRWNDAHGQLARHFLEAPQRFVIGPAAKQNIVDRIRREFPDAAAQAAARADRIVTGEYDLLAYRGLRFGGSCLPDWHFDPVNDRRASRDFWAKVPYLDPAYGDHKVIWELNRHQHWIALGRAYWLTGDSRYRERVLAELDSWLDANPPLVGINWASMLELAFRSLSWIWAIQMFGETETATETAADDRPWLIDLLVALDRQLTHVEHNLSHYFSPNTHLLGEALALYVGGRVLPELRAAERWTSTGRRILIQEIDRQIATDGGHCERSTHYHRYTLDFYALALVVARRTADHAAIPRFEEAVARLGAAARLLADDHGRVPHFGDDDAGSLTPIVERDPDDLRGSLAIAAALVDRPDFRIGAPPEEERWLLGADVQSAFCDQQSAMVPSGALPETGYFISRSTAHHLVIDGGAHGYQNGGHAHADALSLTLAVRGVPLLIDPGTGCYTTDAAMRDRMRSSAMHNTLTLDDRSQSVPRGPFHWAQVANARVHRWRTHDGWDFFDGSEDGYRPIEHRRRVLSLHGDLIVVADFIGAPGPPSRSSRFDAPGPHAAATHWHLDPRWTVDARARGAVFSRADDRVGLSVPHGVVEAIAGDAETGLGFWSPAYGRIEQTTAVRITHRATAPFWMVSVFDLDRANPVSDVDWVPVWAEAGALEHAAAVRITRASSIDHIAFAEHGAGALWRLGDVETDARMIVLRGTAAEPLTCLAAVDATTATSRNRELLNQEPSCAALQAS